MGVFALFWLVLVVALAMGVAMFAAYARDLNRRLDAATSGAAAREKDLDAVLAELRDRQAEIVERIENLEAIVTSEAWDALVEERPVPPVSLDVPEPEPESAAAQAARLAKRLGNRRKYE